MYRSAWSGRSCSWRVNSATAESPRLRAGTAAVDVSPVKFPVLINGGFLQNSAAKVNDPLFARCLVLDDGTTRLAIVVVDSCMMPRELLDRAKEIAREKTGIPTDRMLISATHTHSAPAAMGALGCPADSAYAADLPGRIAEAIARAAANLAPARVGWGAIDDDRHTFCRRWIRRPDRMIDDPFGQRTVRANMHPGHVNPDAIAPSGPVDPALTVLSVQSAEGRPIAVLANYSQHYFGATPVSADYYGRFATAAGAEDRSGAGGSSLRRHHVAGDQRRPDVDGLRAAAQRSGNRPLRRRGRRIGLSGLQVDQHYHDHVSLAMAETTLTLRRRVPDEARLKWARAIVSRHGRSRAPEPARGLCQGGHLPP